ncbi:hypothetical protein GCM10028778_04820 [Barrientosiimonas marina]|uniref:YtzI protein n=1 Tax=Lentibacillus kimchii TaxID=1542911 RepID=A0ABW2UQQ4_9BACI
MMDFLYFPDDKSEYIPAVIILAIFVIGAVLTLYFFIRYSKKEAARADARYQQDMNRDED